MNASPYQLPHTPEAEASILGGVILRPEAFARVQDLEVGDFYDNRHKVVFAAMRNLAHAGRPIDVVLLEDEIERAGKLDAIGGVAFLGELCLRVPTADNVEAYKDIVQQDARNRRVAIELESALLRVKRGVYDPDQVLTETIGELQRLVPDPAATAKPAPWFRGRQLVTEIMRYANEPWVDLRVGGEVLGRVRAGGIVVVMGGSGSGKSSLTSALLLEHARHVGPAIALSIELPAEEMAGRMVGMQCDASWEEALRGQVRIEFMESALDLPRLFVIDRAKATLANLDRCIDAARAEYPNEPILVAIDYAQILESAEKEIRLQVAGSFKSIDEISRRQRVVTIAVSQMGRAGAEAATSGAAIGAASTSLGAESAAIERFATMTLSIGVKSEPFADGTQNVEVSLGKGRMSGGDRVFPMNYWGRTGRWRVAGTAKQAAEVREVRDSERSAKLQQSLELALLGAAMKAPAPVTREELCEQVQGRGTHKRSAVACLVARGDLVEIAIKKARSRTWLVWSPERAAEAGVKLVRDMEDDR